MEVPSALGHRGQVLWKGSLLAASLLAFWIPSSTAQIRIDMVPNPNRWEKTIAIYMYARNVPEDALKYTWYRGKNMTSENCLLQIIPRLEFILFGSKQTGREMGDLSGNLLLRNITEEDSDYYSVEILAKNNEVQQATVLLNLHEPSIQLKPTSMIMRVRKNHLVYLMCPTKYDEGSFSWFFKRQSLLATKWKKLSTNNKTLTIEHVREEDAGSYRCEYTNKDGIHRRDTITLEVFE